MDQKYLRISASSQLLEVIVDDVIWKKYPISTARNGLGEVNNSGQTPRGWHVIRAKIGADQALNSVFVARRPTGEIYSAALGKDYPARDWILTRILWLSGLEVGKNRLGNVDSMRRYIYIHGCPDEIQLGLPLSKGCIRMHNSDIVELFNRVEHGTKVFINE